MTGKFRNTYNVQIEQALKEDRLLILVLQREESDGKGFEARLRNQWIISQVQHIVCGYINPNGSIFGLLAGHSNITHLFDKADLKAAEAVEKPYRWTVAEDKRLLRMYYEDMGIHAIHKAIGRPYSTVYRRVKSLTMNDELLKGREFEDYVLELLGVANNDKLTLKEWRGDKSLPGIYPEGNSNPDLVLEYDGRPFAIECKWRSHMPKDISKELLPPARAALFEKYAMERRMPIFLLLGIGGLPSDPDVLYIMSDFRAPMPTTIQADQLLETITKQIPTPVKKERGIRPLIELYPNAYAPWSTEDDKLLVKLYESGKTIDELAKLFGRNSGGIKYKLRKLNLI